MASPCANRVRFCQQSDNASAYLARQPPGHSLQPTALVHEAYLRLAERSLPDWQDRVHFISIAARIMRQVLVDHARSRSALKRCRGQRAVEFRDTLAYTDEKASQLIVLDDALDALEKLRPGRFVSSSSGISVA